MTGKKYDQGKLRRSLLPQRAHQEVLKVLEYGAQKYGDDNWRTLENLQVRYDDAAGRHEDANRSGETLDPESGLPHLAHAICSLYFQLEDQLSTCSCANCVIAEGVEEGTLTAKPFTSETYRKALGLEEDTRTGQLAIPGTFREAGEEY